MNIDRRLIRLTQSVRLYLALTVGAGLLAGVATVLQALYLSRTVNLAFLEGRSLDQLRPPLLALLLAIAARAALVGIRETAALQAASRIKTALRERLFAHLLALGPAYCSGERTGELANSAVEGVEALEGYFGQYLPSLALAALVPITVLAFVFPLDLLSGLVFLLTAPLIPLFMILIGKLAEVMTRRQWESLSRMSAHFLDVLQGLTTLKLFGRSRAQVEVIARVSDRFRHTTMGVLRVAFLSALALELLSTLSTAIVAVEVGLRLLYGTLSFEQAFLVLILAPEFYLPLRNLGTGFHAGISGVAAARRLFEILETPVPDGETGRRGDGENEDAGTRGRRDAETAMWGGDGTKGLPLPGGQGRGTRNLSLPGGQGRGEGVDRQGDAITLTLTLSQRERGFADSISQRERESPRLRISASPCLRVPASPRSRVPASPFLRFDDVHYSYDGGRRPALKGVSFEVARGEKVALVGLSGAGKSTVAQLLMRFLRPDRGEILVEGWSLDQLPPEEWRRQIAWVPQNPYLFHGTVAENLRLARPEARHEEMVRAARLAHADEFIRLLPQGYDTVIGERGERLSGGQAQRLALARAFLKDAPFLILDEAASHLDSGQEVLVEEALERLMEGRTVLAITHRLSTVYRADRILVLEGGRIVEAGSHRQLMETDGLYHRLVEAYGGDESCSNDFSRSSPCRQNERLKSLLQADGADDDQEPNVAAPFMGARASWGKTVLHHEVRTGVKPAATESTGVRPAAASVAGTTLLRLLRLAAPFKGWMALSALLGLATVGSGIGLMATAAFLIAGAALHPSVADLAVPIVGVRFFGLSRGVFRYLERYVSHGVTFRLLGRLRVWFYQALEPLAPARLMEQRSGDLLSRVVADVELLQHFYVRVLAPPLVALLVGLLMGAFLGGFDAGIAWTLTLFLLASGLGVPLLTHRWSRGTGRRATKLRAELSVQLVDGLQGMADLLAFGQGERQLGRVRAIGREWAATQERMARVTGLHGALGTLLANLGMWSVLVVAIPLVSGGKLEGVYLPVVALAALASFEAVAPLPAAFQQLGGCLEAARRLFEIVDGNRTDGETRRHGDASPFSPSPAPDLVVEDLRFRYGPGEPTALDGVSFRLPAGGRLALVGPSGAGKSTLLHLLLRFWDYQEGQILLGGRELRDYPEEELRGHIGVVSQRAHLFNGTIRENLLVARPDATEEQLRRALQRAQLLQFVEALPQGYDSWIGEQGLRLSGGERQRLAIARALLKDAPLLLLDEPTAHLDSLTERALLSALQPLMEGRTTLIVTHRLVGLEAVDRILVLETGRVVEQGRHEELLRQEGLYRRMWRLQNRLLND